MRSSNDEARAAVAEERDPHLRVKLVWLTVFRTVAVTLLLMVVAWRLLSRAPVAELTTEDSITFAVIAVVFFLNLVHGLVLRRGDVGPRAAYVQVLGDVVLATGLIYLTGGADSPFTFVYSLAIIAGATILFQRGAAVAAASSASAFTVLLLLIQWGGVRPPVGGESLAPSKLVFAIASNVLAQVLVAVLASYLTRELRLTGRQLFAREVEVQQLERLQTQIMASMPSGLITCSSTGEVTFINRAGMTILGVDDSVLGRPVGQVVPGADGTSFGRRTELHLSRDGRDLIIGATSVPLDRPASGTLLVFQDLTDLRRTEELLRRTDRLAELGAMAATLAHEIRNPLAAMRGAAQMLAGENGSDTSRTLTEILMKETDRLSSLVRDFLLFARPAAPQRNPVDLDQLARDLAAMVQSDPLSRGVEIDVQAKPAPAFADADQLRQVVLNLLRNALVAAGPGGRVKVATDVREGRPSISVWDSAGAIPPENLKKIFDPFFTTREGGTGLGLSTAHSIVGAHGGVIDVTSSPRDGTQFVVTLARVSEDALDANPGR